MAAMEYKGYLAKIDYDADLDSFMGNAIKLSSLVTFYGKTPDELKKQFAKSIGQWLAGDEKGITPEKPYSGRMTARMDPEVHRAIATAAAMPAKA